MGSKQSTNKDKDTKQKPNTANKDVNQQRRRSTVKKETVVQDVFNANTITEHENEDFEEIPEKNSEFEFSLYHSITEEEKSKYLKQSQNQNQSVLFLVKSKPQKDSALNSKLKVSTLQKISEEIILKKLYHLKFEQVVWVKVLQKNEKNLNYFTCEVNALRNMSHPNIIVLKDFFQDDKAYYIVYNSYDGIPLFKYLKKKQNKINDFNFQVIIRQLMNTIRYVHFKRFVHANLTPDNIYYNGVNIMILGWENVSNLLKTKKLKKVIMPKHAQSPEMKKKRYYSSTDVWNIGLIFASFCPKEDQTNKEIFSKNYQKFINEYCEEQLNFENINIFKMTYTKNFMNSLLQTDYKKRLDIFKVQEHEFYQNRLKQENPDDFILAAKYIYSYVRRNPNLDRIKVFYTLNIINYEEKQMFNRIMNVFDLNQRGCLDFPSFINGIQRASPEIDMSKAKEIYNVVDDDGNGFIEFNEFIGAFFQDDEIVKVPYLKQIFTVILDEDKQNSQIQSERYLTVEEIIEKLEMDDEQYENFFNMWKEKLQESNTDKIYQDDFVNYIRTQHMLVKLKDQLLARLKKKEEKNQVNYQYFFIILIMEKIIKIVDFGSSEYRIGDSGEIQYSFFHETVLPSNYPEFFHFLNINRTGNTKNTNIIFIEKNSKNFESRQKICQYFFEQENYNSIMFVRSGTMALYSVGQKSGIVLENSETSSELVQIEDSFLDQKTIKKGRTCIIDYYWRLNQAGITLPQFRNSLLNSQTQETILPDGQICKFGSYFDTQNKLLETLYEINSKKQIVIIGGVMKIPKFYLPIKNSLLQNKFEILNSKNCIDFEKNAAFIGASILSQISNLKNFFVTQEQYNEHGVEIIQANYA